MTSRKQPQKIEPNANSLERAMAGVGERLSVKETEETWDSIADAVEELNGLIDQVGGILPDESAQGLRSVAHAITSAASSERSRLSAVTVALLTTAACQLGRAFEPLIPNFLPTLLALCSRTSKVFITRARACIIAIVQNTQSPLILSYLTHYAKDKSTSLRLTVAESALACLNSFNPPDLQREARSKEVELLIRCAATDANPDVRKTGKKLYDAYKVLLPERVERSPVSFATPLTPTIRKYLNINVKSSKGLARQQTPSNPSSRPSSALSTRSALTSSSSSAPAESYNTGLPPSTSTSLGRLQPPPSTSLTSAHCNVPTRPHTSLGTVTASSSQDPRPISSLRAHHMPPPDLIPSRPTHPLSSSSQQPQLTTSREQMREHSRTGPLRPSPSESLVPSSSSHETTSIEVKRPSGGARRVLLPNATPAANLSNGTRDREVERKGPARPMLLCEASPLGNTLEIERKKPQDVKEPAPTLQKESHAATAPKKHTSTDLHKAQEKTRDRVVSQSTRAREIGKGRAIIRHAPNTSRFARPASAEPPPQQQVRAQQLKAVPAAVKTKRPATKAQEGTLGDAANLPTRRKAAGKIQSQPVSQGSKAPATSLRPVVVPESTSEVKRQDMTFQEMHHNKITSAPLPQLLQAQLQPQPNAVKSENEAEDTSEQVQGEPYSIQVENMPRDENSGREQDGQLLHQQEVVAGLVRNRSPEGPETRCDGQGTIAEAGFDESLQHEIAHAPRDDSKCTPASPSSPPAPPTPPAPVFELTIDSYATPKATTSSPILAAKQTPISALVHSIQRGFVWTPRPGNESLSYIGEGEEEEEWEGDTTFSMSHGEFDAEATGFLTTRPLTWGPLDAARLYTQADKQMVQTGS